MPESKPDKNQKKPDLELTLRQGEPDLSRSRELSLPPAQPANPEAPPLEGYVLSSSLGRGAHGEVWRALQKRTRKEVAVKIFHSQEGLNWLFLQREVERLVRLDKHPHITTLLDADLEGATPFYAMELMELGSLQGMVAKKLPVPAAQVADWMAQAARALFFVHNKDLIHCDLKPANLLLDNQGAIRLADFGQSRLFSSDPGSLGTLHYMPPEQAVVATDGSSAHPDPRWDVYGLGATAYALLKGAPPLEGPLADRLKPEDSLEKKLEEYQAVLAAFPPRLGSGDPAGLDQDLAAIVNKCLEADPERRYQDMAALLSDLNARRDKKAIKALSHDKGYVARKFFLRHWGLLLLGLASLGASYGYINKEIQSRRALTHAAFLLHARDYARSGDFGAAALAFAGLNARQPSAMARLNAQSYLRQLSSPRLQWSRPPVEGIALFHPGEKQVLLARADKSLAFYSLRSGKLEGRSLSKPSPPRAADLSADGAWLAAGFSDGSLRLWPQDKGALAPEPLSLGSPIRLLKFSPEGGSLMAATEDGRLHLLAPKGARSLGEPLKHPGPVRDAAFSPDESLVLSACEDGVVRLWEARSGKLLKAMQGPKPALACGFTPDGLHFYEAGNSQEIRLWSLKKSWLSLKVERAGRTMRLEGKVKGALAGPDGSLLLAWGQENRARLFSLPSGRPSGAPMAHEGWIRDAAFSPDGSRILSAGNDKTLRLWSLSGAPLGTPLSHESEVWRAAFSPEGDLALGVSADGVARLWGLSSLGNDSNVTAMPGLSNGWLSPDGKRVAGLHPQKGLRSFGPGRNPKLDGLLRSACFDAKGRLLAARRSAGKLELIDVGQGKAILAPLPWPGLFQWAPDGSGAAMTRGKRLEWLDFKPGSKPQGVDLPSVAESIFFSPEAGLLGARLGRKIWFHKIPSLESLGSPLKLEQEPLETLLLPGRPRLLARLPKKIQVLDLGTGRGAGFDLPVTARVLCMAADPQGRLAFLGCEDSKIRVMDLESGEPVGEPIACAGAVKALRFSADGRSLLAVSESASKLQRLRLPWIGEHLDADELLLKAQVLSRRDVSAQGKAEPLSPARWKKLAKALYGEGG